MSNTPLMPRSMELSIEGAYEEIEKMTEVVKDETPTATVYSGFHPDHGAIHIVIPPTDKSLLLLPFAIRQF